MKFLLLVLVIVAAAWWIGRSRRRVPPPSRPDAVRRDGADPRRAPGAAEMVACAHCGLHVPRQEALPGPDGVVFCSDAHRRAGAAR